MSSVVKDRITEYSNLFTGKKYNPPKEGETEEQKNERLEKERIEQEEKDRLREQENQDYQRMVNETEIMIALPNIKDNGYQVRGFRNALRIYAENQRAIVQHSTRLADIAEELAKKFEPKVWRE